jgi:hypothetical protein
MALSPVMCLQCGAALPIESRETATCPYCHAAYTPPLGVCPQCRHINTDEANHCAQCGTPLFENCPECGHSNRIGEKCCAGCGADLNAAWRMTRGFQQAYTRQREELRKEMVHLRQAEDAQSRARYQQLLDEDTDRLQAEFNVQKRKQVRDNVLQMVVGVALILFLVLVIAVVIVGTVR